MTSPPKVQVLISTFNGEKFIRAQIESILSQLPADGQITIRDDGSGDGTIAAIEAIADARIHLIHGNNLGFGGSFMRLIQEATIEADMVMLSDQDDIWFQDKIQRSWQALAHLSETPALYCSAQRLTDSDLNPLNDTKPWVRPPAFENAIVENIVTGCTAAFNRKALLLLQKKNDLSKIYFHDWWLYLVMSAFGKIIYDPQPSLYYRQHGNNVIGHGAGLLMRQLQMLKFLLKHDWANILVEQVYEFNKSYRHLLNENQRRIIDAHFSITEKSISLRPKLFFKNDLWRQSRIHEIPLRILLLRWHIKSSSR